MRIYFLSIFLWMSTIMLSQNNYKYIDAAELNIIGKIEPTPSPYHRIDSVKHKGFNSKERQLLREPAGLKVCFKTNSKSIAIKASYIFRSDNQNTMGMSKCGFDLHIKDKKQWVYAASGVPNINDEDMVLIKNMNGDIHECILYLPILSELKNLSIGIDSTATIEPSENPFRHRIAIFGSSFMHGVGTSRASMSVPMQLERNTGLHFISLAVDGNCKLQQTFATILANSNVDAIVIDAFSNLSASIIEERFLSFIETIRSQKPHTPIIFLQTIYRERGNFDIHAREFEKNKCDMARKMVRLAQKRYSDIYFIDKPDMTGNDHLTSTDGTHPSDLGYYRWTNTIQPVLQEILNGYNIN